MLVVSETPWGVMGLVIAGPPVGAAGFAAGFGAGAFGLVRSSNPSTISWKLAAVPLSLATKLAQVACSSGLKSLNAG